MSVVLRGLKSVYKYIDLHSRRRRVGVDEQQRWRPLAAEQEVQRVVESHGSHMQQVATRRRGGGPAGVQLHRQLQERRRTSLTGFTFHSDFILKIATFRLYSENLKM